MANDRFLIAPIQEGLRTDLRPWLLPDNAFQKLQNVYMRQGRIKKRLGSSYTGLGWTNLIQQSLLSRLRITLTGGAAVGITDAGGAATGKVPGNIFKIGQAFSIGTTLYTVYQTGAMLKTAATTTCTFNTTTGAYVFAGAPALTQIYFYPSEPVMALANIETYNLLNRPALAFDTQFAYQYTGAFWNRIGPTVGSQFHGTNSQFFNICNWHGITSDLYSVFVTNFNATVPANANDDPMWSYDGTGIGGWAAYQPALEPGIAGRFIRSAKLIVAFKERLLLLNTVENDHSGGLGVNTAYTNRCRISHAGNPLATNAFYEPNTVGWDGGSWIDASTKEDIIGAQFIKDRLIVFFERSTWELAYTYNNEQPFVWQKLNTELGSESTFSSVPFDKAILTVGGTGIHSCNGSNVVRIDDSIYSKIFEIRNDNNGPSRVAGIRDYFTEMVYWTFPSSNSDNYAVTYPNQVLVYNYKEGVWAINDDSITAFGYFEQTTGVTWAMFDLPWYSLPTPWSGGAMQKEFQKVLAGNQQGFVFTLESGVATNEKVLQITSLTAGAGNSVILYIRDHNLATGSYIQIDNCLGSTSLNGKIYQITTIDTNRIQVDQPGFAGVYTGGGVASTVSRIDIITKRFNPYVQEGVNFSIDSVDFAVQKTTSGEVTVDYNTSSSMLSMVDESIVSNSILGLNILETYPYPIVPFEATQELLWHRVYCMTEGDSIQLRIYFSDDQMVIDRIISSNFELEGFILNTSAKGIIS